MGTRKRNDTMHLAGRVERGLERHLLRRIAKRLVGFACAQPTLMVAVAVFSLTGCEKQTELEARSGQKLGESESSSVDASLDSISTGASGSSSTSSLAAQSQRDVDMILKSRAAVDANDASASETAGDAAVNQTQPPRKAVMWNDPKRGGGPNAKPDEKPQAVEVKPGAEAAAPKTVPGPQLSAPAAGSLAADRLKSLMVDLSRELYASGSYSSTPLRELLMIAAMSMIDPQRAIDPQSVPDLTEKERELLAKLQEFFASLGRSLENNSDTEAAIVEAVAKLREALVNQPALRLPAAVLCTRVGGFGDYTPFEKYVFLAQSQQKAILYLEIADFISELNGKGEHVTQIAQQLTIYSDSDGIPVWKEDWQTAVDVTKVKRQDFFTVQVITLPKALSVGKFHLKVRVRDEKSQAEAETSIPFEMVADPRMAVIVGK